MLDFAQAGEETDVPELALQMQIRQRQDISTIVAVLEDISSRLKRSLREWDGPCHISLAGLVSHPGHAAAVIRSQSTQLFILCCCPVSVGQWWSDKIESTRKWCWARCFSGTLVAALPASVIWAHASEVLPIIQFWLWW